MGLSAASFYARLLTSYGALVICASYGAFTGLLLRPFKHHRNIQYLTARLFKFLMRPATGVSFEIVSGKEYLSTPRPCVIIGNHQSELDVLFLGTIFPPYTSVTAKSSLKLIPFLGWFMALSGTVFIDRHNRADALKAFQGAAQEMRREKQNVFIFPEGTRSYANGPELGAFKKGAFHLAVQAGADIVPVVAANYAGVLNVGKRRFRAGRIPVQVLPPISTKSLTVADVEELTRTTREAMLAALISLTESPIGQKATLPVVTAKEGNLNRVAMASGSGMRN
ncbi:1-acylglycerol-3-phosphate O-acyltransferase [Sticta canariensis]|nr:1-acylglycerol-3-phosphate O-acyltransferase [Sticta canariensis]